MSNKIGKYTYENKTVLKEFLGSMVRALARKKASNIIVKLKKDPEMAKLLKQVDDYGKKVDQRVAKQRKSDKELDRYLKSIGE